MSLRLCSYNIQWFNKLFNKDNTLKTGSKEQDQIAAIRDVLLHIQPDFIGIVEAPNSTTDGKQSTIKKLENFAQYTNLPLQKAVTGFLSRGLQEIAGLYNTDKLNVTHSPGGITDSRSNPPFDGEFYFDTDDDRIKEVYTHYRPPLELLVSPRQSEIKFKIIVAHTKSKGIFSSMDFLHWQRESRRNRLKLFAECEWIRRRVDEWLEQDDKVIVMGDINDGPGMDYYEVKYGRSAVELIMGDIFEPDHLLHNYAGKPKWTSRGWKPASASFKDRITETTVNVLIDHILASSGLPVVGETPLKIWNPYYDSEAKAIKKELLKASDHFPVTLDLDL